MTLFGDSGAWYADDPDRACYTCGAPPTYRFADGSPGYGCGPHPPVRGRSPETLEEAGVRLVWTLGGRDPEIVEACVRRMIDDSRSAGRRDRQGNPFSVEHHRRGYAGEMAFARIIGLGFRCRPGRGFGKPDVGRYQVRTSGGHPFLVVHENDPDAIPVALMIGRQSPGPFRLAGWLERAGRGKREEYIRDPGGRRPAFFVPLAALASPLTIPELARPST